MQHHSLLTLHCLPISNNIQHQTTPLLSNRYNLYFHWDSTMQSSIIINSRQSQMWEQSQAQQNLCNYSEEPEMTLNWFDRRQESRDSLRKANSSGKLALMQGTARNLPYHQHTLYPDGIRKKNGGEKTQIKKSSLPQIAFPVLGGNMRPFQNCESTRSIKGVMASKLLHYETQTDRNFHNKFIQKMIEKETERIRATQINERNQIREHNTMKMTLVSQQSKSIFRNYKSLKKTNKTKRLQTNQIRYTTKASSQQLQRRSTNRLSLGDLFKRIE